MQRQFRPPIVQLMPVMPAHKLQRIDRDERKWHFNETPRFAGAIVLTQGNRRISYVRPLRDRQEAQVMQHRLPPAAFERWVHLTKLSSALGRLPLGLSMFARATQNLTPNQPVDRAVLEGCVEEASALNAIARRYHGELFAVFQVEAPGRNTNAYVAPYRGIHINPPTPARSPAPYMAIEMASGAVGEAPRRVAAVQLWQQTSQPQLHVQ